MKLNTKLFKSLSTLTLLLAVSMASGCLKGTGVLNTKRAPEAKGGEATTVKTVRGTDGSVVGSVGGGSSLTQTMQAPADSPVAGAGVSFPPGSLAVSTDVKIEQATSLTTSVTTSQLGIAANIGAVGTPVAIQSSTQQDAVIPFTVSVALPASSSLLLDELVNLVIVYKTKNGSGQSYVGLILRDGISINGGVASFLTYSFGAFQAVITKVTILSAVRIQTVASNVSLAAAAALPAMSLSARSPVVAPAGSRVTLTGKNFRPSLTLAMGNKRVTDVTVASDSVASFVVPSGISPGVTGLSLEEDGVVQNASLIFPGGTDHPFSTKPASEVCQGEQFYNAAGTLLTGTRNCSVQDLSGLTPDRLLAGVTVAGVTGTLTLPAVKNVLAGTTYGAGGAALSGGLTLPPAASVLATAGSYGVGGSGSTPGLGICTTDGASNCVVSGLFKAANVSGVSPWDLRAGQSLAGVTGALKTNCRNAANSSVYNYDGPMNGLSTTIQTGGTIIDIWDTLDDYLGATQRVAGWDASTYCDATTFTDVTTTDGGATLVSCGTSNTCIYKDKISNLQVTGLLSPGENTTVYPETSSPQFYAWNTAIMACAGSTYGGYAAGTWRLPTQKEALALYEHGFYTLVSSGSSGLGSPTDFQNFVLTSTGTANPSVNTSYAQVITFASGRSGVVAKSGSYYALCVK